MAIPSVVGRWEVLPPGRHVATLDEIEAYFVSGAPFAADRALIFDALRTWKALVEQIIPVSRYWVDGGFVTLKPWAPPSDVDVTIICQESDLNSLGEREQQQLQRLLTVVGDPGPRVAPMGGLVDAYLTPRSGPTANVPYWANWWAQVRDVDGSVVPSEQKGFLEVIP